jgi:hypothetical protein
MLIMKSDTPYAVAIFAAVCFAIGLMTWSLPGTSGGRQVAITTGTSTSRQTETPTPAPGPLTKTRVLPAREPLKDRQFGFPQ